MDREMDVVVKKKIWYWKYKPD